MKISATLVRILLACALQFAFGAALHRGAWPVDWFLLAVAAEALSGDFARSTVVGGVAGLLEDALTQPLLGANVFAKALLGYLLTAMSVRIVFEGALAVGLILVAASVVNDAIVALLGTLLLSSRLIFWTWEAIVRAATTGLAGAVLFAAASFPWREEWQRRRARRLR